MHVRAHAHTSHTRQSYYPYYRCANNDCRADRAPSILPPKGWHPLAGGAGKQMPFGLSPRNWRERERGEEGLGWRRQRRVEAREAELQGRAGRAGRTRCHERVAGGARIAARLCGLDWTAVDEGPFGLATNIASRGQGLRAAARFGPSLGYQNPLGCVLPALWAQIHTPDSPRPRPPSRVHRVQGHPGRGGTPLEKKGPCSRPPRSESWGAQTERRPDPYQPLHQHAPRPTPDRPALARQAKC